MRYQVQPNTVGSGDFTKFILKREASQPLTSTWNIEILLYYRRRRSANAQANSCPSDNKYSISNVPSGSTSVMKDRKKKEGSGSTAASSGPGVKFPRVCGITLKARGARQKIGRLAPILNDSGGRMPAATTKTKTRGNIGWNEKPDQKNRLPESQMSFKRMRGRRRGDGAAVTRRPANTNLLRPPQRIHIKSSTDSPRPEPAQIAAEGSFVGNEQPAALFFPAVWRCCW